MQIISRSRTRECSCRSGWPCALPSWPRSPSSPPSPAFQIWTYYRKWRTHSWYFWWLRACGIPRCQLCGSSIHVLFRFLCPTMECFGWPLCSFPSNMRFQAPSNCQLACPRRSSTWCTSSLRACWPPHSQGTHFCRPRIKIWWSCSARCRQPLPSWPWCGSTR